MFDKLKTRWNLKSTYQVVIVLVVFACTGFTILFIKKPIVAWIAGSEESSLLYSILYYMFILPVYNIILLAYGFVFGQFTFFWEFEKKMWSRITGKKYNNDAD
ncbi:DUF6787 family protein [Reichenbachiella sp. MALMAid0571]|uniref:DUF6787 family protein n=1 Tax=Reichenbachiella sp. MALMAid0571 TaxID=3143939 RepID=UPI0032E02334